MLQETRSSKSSTDSEDKDNTAAKPSVDTRELDTANPLSGLTDVEIYNKVQKYTSTASTVSKHLELLTSGAHLAHNKQNALRSRDLFPDSYITKRQRDYLLDEEQVAGFWQQSKFLKGSVLSACLAGIIQ